MRNEKNEAVFEDTFDVVEMVENRIGWIPHRSLVTNTELTADDSQFVMTRRTWVAHSTHLTKYDMQRLRRMTDSLARHLLLTAGFHPHECDAAGMLRNKVECGLGVIETLTFTNQNDAFYLGRQASQTMVRITIPMNSDRRWSV